MRAIVLAALSASTTFLFPFVAASAASTRVTTTATTSVEIESLLHWFDTDTKSFMERSVSGAANENGSPNLIDPKALEAKNQIREQILNAARKTQPGLGSAQKSDQKIEDFLNPSELTVTSGKILKDPRTMDDLGMNQANVTDEVWSGPAWAQYRGHTAERYNLAKARNSSTWKEAWSFVAAAGHTFFDVGGGHSPDTTIDDLGPAEKYDLLIGALGENKAGLLSKYEWDQGRSTFERDGTVAKWFGYCHGWAVASFMSMRPSAGVDILAADGKTQVHFYPSDIKGLETVLWANALPELRTLGHRCEISNPPRDSSGHVIDDACFDVNPGLFHEALVNQLGSAKRNLIIDATYDIQIWNQPIESYSYRYFNPQTGKAGGSLTQSTVALENFKKDKFRKYRGPDVKDVVGVAMDIVYGRGALPSHKSTDSAADDLQKKVTYLYDLELDENGEIIGGEWYQLRHPDFIWVPDKSARAQSVAEKNATGSGVDEWEAWSPTQSPVPQSWQKTAIEAAQNGSPLAHVLDQIVMLSRSASN
jgi:hypothetical protein